MRVKSKIEGVGVNNGVATGKARVVRSAEDVNSFQKGDVLIIPSSNPMYAIAVMNALAVVCEIGGRLAHICVVAMEMGIPCVTQVPNATSMIEDGQLVQVNADEGAIYVYEE